MMQESDSLFNDLDCGYEELLRSDHFCIQMLADKAEIRIMVKKNGKKERYKLKWSLNYRDWKALRFMMAGDNLKDRDRIIGPVEYRYLPVGRAALWINGKQFQFEGTLGEFRRAILAADKKIVKLGA
jgi:hypothetical protein